MILGTIFSIIPSFIFWTGNTIGVNGGYSLIWFVFLYLLAAYIRKYGKSWDSRIPWCVIYFIACLFTFAIKIIQELMIGKAYWKSYSYTSITVVIASIAIFMSFMNWGLTCKETRTDALWRLLGKGTLGVFLIHTHFIPYKEFLWNKWCKADVFWINHNIWLCILHFIIWVLGIFIICDIIDIIRGWMFIFFEGYLNKVKNHY